mgnify:CR=1 FL=1
MRPRKYATSISVMVTDSTRIAIERLSYEKRIGLGEAARELLTAGIEARGLEC